MLIGDKSIKHNKYVSVSGRTIGKTVGDFKNTFRANQKNKEIYGEIHDRDANSRMTFVQWGCF